MPNTPPLPDPLALDLQAVRAAEDAIVLALARLLLAESTGEMRSGRVRAAAPPAARREKKAGRLRAARGK
jgi:hypothetical protein